MDIEIRDWWSELCAENKTMPEYVKSHSNVYKVVKWNGCYFYTTMNSKEIGTHCCHFVPAKKEEYELFQIGGMELVEKINKRIKTIENFI